MMRRLAVAVSFLLVVACLSWPCRAAPVFPALTGRVVDNAGLLSPAAEQRLTDELASYEAGSGNQIVVVTLDSLQGQSIEEFGYRLGRQWGIGKKGLDNGALLIVAPKERAVRIEVGYGLEDRLTDAATSLIIGRVITPAFRAGDFEGGIAGGVHAMVQTLGGQALADTAQPSPDQGDDGLPFPVILLFLIIYLVFFRGRRSGMLAPLIIGTLGSGSRRGGSGSGGFRGGGGGFGGGGASGRW